MAYKLVCVHPFHDDITGKHINLGEEVHDYTQIAKLVAANREHHFNKVHLLMADAQWEWPPKLPVETVSEGEYRGGPKGGLWPPAPTHTTPMVEGDNIGGHPGDQGEPIDA